MTSDRLAIPSSLQAADTPGVAPVVASTVSASHSSPLSVSSRASAALSRALSRSIERVALVVASTVAPVVASIVAPVVASTVALVVASIPQPASICPGRLDSLGGAGAWPSIPIFLSSSIERPAQSVGPVVASRWAILPYVSVTIPSFMVCPWITKGTRAPFGRHGCRIVRKQNPICAYLDCALSAGFPCGLPPARSCLEGFMSSEAMMPTTPIGANAQKASIGSQAPADMDALNGSSA